MKALVIIPAYNEQESIMDTIHDLDTYYPQIDRIVINDDSKDHTREILEQFYISHINLPVNLGIGGGVQTGYLYAYENGYDIAIQMDGDGQHCACEIGKLIQPILDGEADAVIGSRFINKVGFQSTPLRRMGIYFLSNLIWCCTGKKIYDVTSGFRAVNRRFIQIFSTEYAQDYPEPEAIITISKYKGKICEVPVIMRERKNGESSIRSFQSLYYMIKVSLAIVFRKINRSEGSRKK